MKVYLVLKELEDPWYGDGNVQRVFDSKEKAEKWINGGYKNDKEYYSTYDVSSQLSVKEYNVL